MTEKTSRATGEKKEIVKVLTNLLETSPIIGVVDMEGLPASPLQQITAKLRGKMELFMTKKRLMNIAIEKAKAKNPDVELLKKYFGGMPAILFTKEAPFKIYRVIKQNKSPAPAKPGQTAPRDLVVKAGPTSFAPGPVISELANIGLKAGVEGGKVTIKQDAVVCKEGEKISAPVAAMLTRLGIQPMEVGLNILAIYENGTIYERNVLDIDEDKFAADIALAAVSAINISVEIGFMTTEAAEIMIMKATREGTALKEIVGSSETKLAEEKPAEEKKEEEKPAEAPKPEAKPTAAPEETPKPAEKPAEIKPVEKKEEAKSAVAEEKAVEAAKPAEAAAKEDAPQPEPQPPVPPTPEPVPKPQVEKKSEGKTAEKPVKKPAEQKKAEKPAEKEISASQLVSEAEKDKGVIAHKQHLKEEGEKKQVENLYEELKKKGTLRDKK